MTLDPAIRNWVLLPIFFVMFVQGLLRHYVTQLMEKEQEPGELGKVKEAQMNLRAGRVRRNAWLIPGPAFEVRRKWFCEPKVGYFVVKEAEFAEVKPTDQALKMLTDPSAATEGMKKQMTMMLPQMLLFFWSNYFFSGFMVAKVPFPLTQRFRIMLQRGVDMSSLDVTWVTALSWYFLNWYGLRGSYGLVLGGDANVMDDARLMQQQMQMAQANPEPAKMYKGLREGMQMVNHTQQALVDSEKRVLEKLRRIVKK